jgi:hypothetical protein
MGERRLCTAEVGGSSPPFSTFSDRHERNTTDTKSTQKQSLAQSANQGTKHQPNISQHQTDTFLHEKCVICVSELPEDLARIVESWQQSPEAVRVGIVAMIQAARE